MTDQEFLEKIYRVAGRLRNRELTEGERSQIIAYFNDASGTNYERAKSAIQKLTGQAVPERFLLIEKAGAINNLQTLVAEMRVAAQEWSKK